MTLKIMHQRVFYLLQLCTLTLTTLAGDAGTLRDGEAVYQMACAQCHYGGEHTANAPALLDSPLLKKPAIETARIILVGQANASLVDGKAFGGIMPAMGYLTNEEVASVVRYVRKTYVNIDEESPTPAQVEALRQEVAAE